MVIPSELEQLHRSHWNTYASDFNLTTNEGCGKYTEHWVKFAQDAGYPKVGHLKKNPGQTQYNGHANDAFLYREGDPTLYRAVDIIGAAESTDPNNPPRLNWGIDIPRYTDSDWLASPGQSQPSNMVPWVPYDEHGFQALKKTLKHDYERRPQNADFDVSVWAARVFHSAFMGPEKTPLGLDGALHKHKPEWCAALGVPLDNYYGE